MKKNSLFLLVALLLLTSLRLSAMEGKEEEEEGQQKTTADMTAENSRAQILLGFQAASSHDSGLSTTEIIEECKEMVSDQREVEVGSRPITLQEIKETVVRYPEAQGFIIADGKIEPASEDAREEERATFIFALVSRLFQKYGKNNAVVLEIQKTYGNRSSFSLGAQQLQSYLNQLEQSESIDFSRTIERTRPSPLTRSLTYASNFNDVKETWNESWPISHDGRNYYTTREVPAGWFTILEKPIYRSTEAKEDHRRALVKIAEGLLTSEAKQSFLERFYSRRQRGAPLTVSAFHEWEHSYNLGVNRGPFSGLLEDGITSLLRVLAPPSPPSREGYIPVPDLGLLTKKEFLSSREYHPIDHETTNLKSSHLKDSSGSEIDSGNIDTSYFQEDSSGFFNQKKETGCILSQKPLPPRRRNFDKEFYIKLPDDDQERAGEQQQPSNSLYFHANLPELNFSSGIREDNDC